VNEAARKKEWKHVSRKEKLSCLSERIQRRPTLLYIDGNLIAEWTSENFLIGSNYKRELLSLISYLYL
jgi:hypothetical protein